MQPFVPGTQRLHGNSKTNNVLQKEDEKHVFIIPEDGSQAKFGRTKTYSTVYCWREVEYMKRGGE